MDIRNVNSESKVCDLSGTLARMGGDHELLQQIVQFFREDAPEYLARLHSAVEGGNSEQVLHAAHSLHGLVATFGAEAAALAALRLEDIGRSGDLSSVNEAVGALEDEISRLQTALARESDGL
jgi:HPt (histidine-containing phosphotransfer) domain-containing protein